MSAEVIIITCLSLVGIAAVLIPFIKLLCEMFSDADSISYRDLYDEPGTCIRCGSKTSSSWDPFCQGCSEEGHW